MLLNDYFKKNIATGISIPYLCAFLLIVFCNFWLFKVLPIQPLYIFFFLSLLGLPFILMKKKMSLSKTQIVSLICFFYFLITSLFVHCKSDFGVASHSTLVFLFYFLSIFYLKLLNKDQVLSIVNWLCSFSFIYILFETYWRFSHPIIGNRATGSDINVSGEVETFYAFKFNSIMFLDSNFTALVLLSMTFLTFYMYKYVKNNKFYKFMTIGFAILLFLALSRAALAAMIITYVLLFSVYFLKKHLQILFKIKKMSIKLFCFILPAIVSIFIITYCFSWFLSDLSFLTKIKIFQDLWDYMQSVNFIDLLLGKGSNLDMLISYFGRSTHAFIPSYIVWDGLLGIALVFYLWFLIIKDTKYKALMFFIPTFISGIALTNALLQIPYVALAIMTYFEKYLLKMNKRKGFYVKTIK